MKNKGFTLIEVMIVVAIIGIISAVAYPSYLRYVTKSKRTECRTAIMQVMQQQERYFTQQNTYLAFSKPTSDASVGVDFNALHVRRYVRKERLFVERCSLQWVDDRGLRQGYRRACENGC
jgi:prepilin-type N-terminal cleavage/methylation domain-containing protein